MSSPAASDLKVFVPSKDFGQSFNFYTAKGWNNNWRAGDDSLAELELAGTRIYLQNYYNADWAHNLMMHITMDEAKTCWEHAARVIADGGHQLARVRELEEQS